MELKLADKFLSGIHELYDQKSLEIKTRIAEFKSLHESEYFYELCYCLLTPQSKAEHCFEVVHELKKKRFREVDFDPEPLLHPKKNIYVRFHKTKAVRLIEMKMNYDTLIHPSIISNAETYRLRDHLVVNVKGIGYKEASHFLRNIGRTDVTILDRHILKNFIELNLIDSYPKSLSRKMYLQLENIFGLLAAHLKIPADELDLLLWCKETGFILK